MESDRTASCERCDADISPEAVECPECGYEHPWGRTNRLVVSLVSGVALLFSLLATSYVVVFWLVDEGSRGFPVSLFATWLTPGLLAVAVLYFAYTRPSRTASGEPVS